MEGVVQVAGGRVRGRRHDGVWEFAGIPYAASPEGERRWRPPQPPEPWTGLREADRFGPIAPQPPAIPGLSIDGDPDEMSEDCLSLNVWTPGLDDRRRPVMVWIHGGSFISGTGSSVLYRGGPLAAQGDVVIVTLNYRLGALGFLAHPALGAGNWGLLDQLAALRWVQAHIVDFGGDPDNVTAFGESAGGMCVAILMAAPPAAGLFHRAVVQSGAPYTHSPGRAAQAAEAVVEVLGQSEVDRASLEEVPASELVAALSVLQGVTPPPGELPLPLLPVVDGHFLPRPPLEAIADGAAADVALLTGTNRDELSLMAFGDERFTAIDEAGLVAWTRHAAPGVDAEAAILAYRRARAARGEPVDPAALWVAMGTDIVFRWPCLRLAAAQRRHQTSTFVYLFTYETPVLGGLLGSCHALEIPFVFGSVRRPEVARFSGGGPDAEALSDEMMAEWTSFARLGVPTARTIVWPIWDPAERSTMVLGPGGEVTIAPRNEELAVWASAAPIEPVGLERPARASGSRIPGT